ncbi:MAG: alpha/beta hydrolase [Chitinophagales bacterium]|nr:alpha/beta hydrolase [Chitinophagales bacterium]
MNLLFVHGAWHGSWCWQENFIPYFEKHGFKCHSFNLPLHNTSGKIKGINSLRIKDYVDALDTEIKKIEGEIILIAHSMGGLIVQKYLEKHGCHKVVLLAPVPHTGVLATTLRFLKKTYSYPALLGFNLYYLVNNEKKSTWAFFSESMPFEKRNKYANKLCSESYFAFLDMLFPNIKLKFHKETPTLILAAEKDNIFSVKEEENTAKFYHADFEVIPNIAHDMMLDIGYENVLNKIHKWLTKE